MNICFRAMRAADVVRIAELERICFRSPWSETSIRGELRNKLAHYQVVESDGAIIAYAGMWVFLGEAHITNVAVDPEYRRQGIGRALMLHMMKTALSYNASAMTLEVREHNEAAKSLYFQLGFEKAGVRKGYYSDTGEAAWILWQHDISAMVDSEAAQC